MVENKQKKQKNSENKSVSPSNFNSISFAGEILAKDFDCNFGEVAAADQVVEVKITNIRNNIEQINKMNSNWKFSSDQ